MVWPKIVLRVDLLSFNCHKEGVFSSSLSHQRPSRKPKLIEKGVTIFTIFTIFTLLNDLNAEKIPAQR